MKQIPPSKLSPNPPPQRHKSLLLSAFMLLIGFGSGYYWPQPVTEDRSPSQLEDMAAQLQATEKQLAQRDVELQIERHAVTEMDNTIKQQQGELIEKQGEIRFYQKIMAPEITANGVVIEDLLLETGISQGHYRFELLLAQLKRRKNFAKGQASIELIGSQQQKPASFSLDMLGGNDKQQSFSFRYFQALKGEFFLPQGFEPEKIKITLKMPKRRGQKKAEMIKEFGWQEVLQQRIQPLLAPLQEPTEENGELGSPVVVTEQ